MNIKMYIIRLKPVFLAFQTGFIRIYILYLWKAVYNTMQEITIQSSSFRIMIYFDQILLATILVGLVILVLI